MITTAKNRRLQPDDLLARIASGGEEELNLFLRIGVNTSFISSKSKLWGLDFNDLVVSRRFVKRIMQICVNVLEHDGPLFLKTKPKTAFLYRRIFFLYSGEGERTGFELVIPIRLS